MCFIVTDVVDSFVSWILRFLRLQYFWDVKKKGGGWGGCVHPWDVEHFIHTEDIFFFSINPLTTLPQAACILASAVKYNLVLSPMLSTFWPPSSPRDPQTHQLSLADVAKGLVTVPEGCTPKIYMPRCQMRSWNDLRVHPALACQMYLFL